MKKILLPLLPLLLLPSLTFAQSESEVLKGGLDIKTLKQCQAALQACKKDLYMRPVCLKQKLYRRPECAQLSAIAKLSSVDADLIDAKNEGNLSLISFRYPADGQVTYAVLSEGKLIPVSIDILKAFPQLEKQYPDVQFYQRVLAEPAYTVNATSGVRQFTAPIRITKDCDVCETVKKVSVVLQFNADGKHISTQVMSP